MEQDYWFHTVELLLKESPKKIIIFDNFERGKLNNLSKSLKDPRVELFKDGGDILKLDLLNSAMQDVDYVFYLQRYGFYIVMIIPKVLLM